MTCKLLISIRIGLFPFQIAQMLCKWGVTNHLLTGMILQGCNTTFFLGVCGVEQKTSRGEECYTCRWGVAFFVGEVFFDGRIWSNNIYIYRLQVPSRKLTCLARKTIF